MASTISRGFVVLTPAGVLGWSLTRPSRSVLHPILGTDETEVTTRPPGLRAGRVRTMWDTYAEAEDASTKLSVVGGAWSLVVPEQPGLTMVMQVTGDQTIEALDDAATTWALDFGVQEVTS